MTPVRMKQKVLICDIKCDQKTHAVFNPVLN